MIFPHLRILSSILKRVATYPDEDALQELDSTKTAMWLAYHDLHNAMSKISKFDDGISSDDSEWGRLR